MKIAHVLKTLTGGWLAALCFACNPQMPIRKVRTHRTFIPTIQT